jgi:hypothetical protein
LGQICSRRFGLESEITIKGADLGYRIYEMPVAYHIRTYAEGKKSGWRDGMPLSSTSSAIISSIEWRRTTMMLIAIVRVVCMW